MRANQKRVAKILFDKDNWRLMPRLSLDPSTRKVFVTADPDIFPAFADGEEKIEITEWLERTLPKTVEYFQQMVALYSALVRRNPDNARVVQKWLPYELLLAVLTDPRMTESDTLLPTCSLIAGLICDLWVEAAPHRPMVYVQHVRIWDKIENAARSAALLSRLNKSKSMAAIDWDMFSTPGQGPSRTGLVREVHSYLNKYNVKLRDCSRIKENHHVLALLQARRLHHRPSSAAPLPLQICAHDMSAPRVSAPSSHAAFALTSETPAHLFHPRQLLHALIEYGFLKYDIDETHEISVKTMAPLLTMMLAGSQDGIKGGAPNPLKVHVNASFDTCVLMECKVWLCRILQMKCTMQVDVNLSLLLLSMVKVPVLAVCPSSSPVPPQRAPGGSGQPGTPIVRPIHWAPSHGLSCLS